MGLDRRAGVRVHHQDDLLEASGDSIAGEEVNHRLPVGADGGKGLDATEPTSSPGRQDDE